LLIAAHLGTILWHRFESRRAGWVVSATTLAPAVENE
jgi:hypothetical protein